MLNAVVVEWTEMTAAVVGLFWQVVQCSEQVPLILQIPWLVVLAAGTRFLQRSQFVHLQSLTVTGRCLSNMAASTTSALTSEVQSDAMLQSSVIVPSTSPRLGCLRPVFLPISRLLCLNKAAAFSEVLAALRGMPSIILSAVRWLQCETAPHEQDSLGNNVTTCGWPVPCSGKTAC